ncbi:MAG TPA: carbohydrate ABC transporter permease [Aestuariivirga sp.]|nr:carbohydrate ABC transporter permease [Aestuariivirga sp.]
MTDAIHRHGIGQRLKMIGTYAVLAIWSLLCLFPVYWLFIASLKGEDLIGGKPVYVPFVDFQPTLDAWRFILADPFENLVWRFINSTVVGLLSSALTVAAAAMAIYSLTRFPRRWRKIAPEWLMSGMLVTRLLPPMVMVLPLYLMTVFTGTHDTRLALIIVYAAVNLPAALWLLQPVLGIRASEQEEAALLEGASHTYILFGIVLPMALGSLAAVGLLVFILCWNEYLFAAFLATNHAMTLPGWLMGQLSIKEAQATAELVEQARLSAACVAAALPLLAMAVIIQRFLARQSLWRR